MRWYFKLESFDKFMLTGPMLGMSELNRTAICLSLYLFLFDQF